MSDGHLNPESPSFETRPPFYIGQHDTSRFETLTDAQHNIVLNSGVGLCITLCDIMQP